MTQELKERAERKIEKFNFQKYFKTDEGIEFLDIFNTHKKEKNLTKAEIMLRTLGEFKTRYPENDTLDRMLAHIPAGENPAKN